MFENKRPIKELLVCLLFVAEMALYILNWLQNKIYHQNWLPQPTRHLVVQGFSGFGC